jgi:hypothetical protein
LCAVGMGCFMRTISRCAVALLAYLAFAAVAAYADGISGTYVGRGTNGAFMVQIVQTSDGRLIGHYTQVVLQGGKLTEMNASINGASDGHTVALTLKPKERLAGSLSLSGTVEGSLFHATGGGYGNTLTLNLTKSSESEFQAAVDELRQQAELANSRRTIQYALPRVETQAKRMIAFSAGLSAYLARFAPIERQYQAITEKMRMSLARQRSIYGEGQAAVARSQLVVAINQAGIEANQLHLSVQSNYNDFNTKSNASLKLIAGMIKLCQSANNKLDDDALVSRWDIACRNLIVTASDFQKHIGMLRDAFGKAERVWQEERAKQERLIHSAFSTQ